MKMMVMFNLRISVVALLALYSTLVYATSLNQDPNNHKRAEDLVKIFSGTSSSLLERNEHLNGETNKITSNRYKRESNLFEKTGSLSATEERQVSNNHATFVEADSTAFRGIEASSEQSRVGTSVDGKSVKLTDTESLKSNFGETTAILGAVKSSSPNGKLNEMLRKSDNLMVASGWPSKTANQYSFGRRNSKTISESNNEKQDGKGFDLHEVADTKRPKATKIQPQIFENDEEKQFEERFSNSPFKNSPLNRKVGLKESASYDHTIMKKSHQSDESNEKCSQHHSDDEDHKEHYDTHVGVEEEKEKEAVAKKGVEKHHHHYHHHHHVQKPKKVKKVQTPPVQLEIQIKGNIKTKPKQPKHQKQEEKVVVVKEKKVKKPVVVNKVKKAPMKHQEEYNEDQDEPSQKIEHEDSSGIGGSESVTDEQNDDGQSKEEHKEEEGSPESEKSGVEEGKEHNSEDAEGGEVDEEALKERETPIKDSEEAGNEQGQKENKEEEHHHHEFGHVINTSLVPGYDTVINDEAPILIKEEKQEEPVKVEVKEKEKHQHKRNKSKKIEIGMKPEKKEKEHKKVAVIEEEKKVVAPVVEVKGEEKKQHKVEKQVHKEKQPEQQVEHKPTEKPQVVKVEEEKKGDPKKVHKHQHIELHAHKHYEQHQHINLHDSNHEKPHEEPEEEQHQLVGQHEEHGLHHHQEEIPHEVVELDHHHHHHNLLNQHPVEHHHQQHEPIPIKEHWIVPEMHELPAHEGGKHHHHHPSPIVIEDHSDLEQDQPHHPVQYKEEVVIHPHGFGLTPSGHGYLGAYSTTSSTHLASSNATTKV